MRSSATVQMLSDDHNAIDVVLPSLAIEVPIHCSVRGHRVPTIDVPSGDGGQLFAFPASTVAGSTLRPDRQIPVAVHTPLTASTTLVWKIEAEEPSVLSLEEFFLTSDQREARARLQFAHPLLPHISSFEEADVVQLSAITADGTLHVVKLSAQRQQQMLHRQLAAHSALRAVPLAATFQRLGAPTCLLHVSDHICVGTDQGHVLCFPSASSDPLAAVELRWAGGGLGGMLASFWARASIQPVQLLAELRFLSRRLLCTFHKGAVFRLWDIDSRRMLHSSELLPPAEAAAYRVALVRIAGEPLDAATSMLLVYFEPNNPSSPQPGCLSTFEVFLEDRGGAYKVQVESGPQLRGAVHRVQDVAAQHVGARTLGVWLLYDDVAGRRALHCVPIVFSDGAVESATEAVLVESQLLRYCGTKEELGVQVEVWRTIEVTASAEALDGVAGAEAVADSFLDILLVPGSLSRVVLHAALSDLGGNVAVEDVLMAELPMLRALLPGWLAACRAACSDGGGGGDGGVGGCAVGIRAWCALLSAYAAAFQRLHRPLVLLQQITHREGQSLMLVRAGGVLSSLRSAESAELLVRGIMPHSWRQLEPGLHGAVKTLLHAAALVTRASGGPLTSRLLWGAMRHGASVHTLLAPATVRAITAGAPPAKAHGRAGPADCGGLPQHPPAAGEAGRQQQRRQQAEWRARCRLLPLALADLFTFGPGEFASALHTLLQLHRQHYHPHLNSKRSPLGQPTAQVMAAALGAAAQVAGVQVECLLRLQLLASYVATLQTLSTWVLGVPDARALAQKVQPAACALMSVAAVGYWAAVTPAAPPENSGGVSDAAAEMVVALHLGGDAGASSAPKRARLTPLHDHYVAELLAASYLPERAHAVRDAADLLAVAAGFARWLLCIRSVPQLDPEGGHDWERSGAVAATLHALSLAPALFLSRQPAVLASLLRLLGQREDARLQFFAACSKLGGVREKASPAGRAGLEEESAALFFRVAAVFGHRDSLGDQVCAVHAAVGQLHMDTLQQALPEEGPDAEELQYYETLMAVYERLGCAHAASRFALAAAQLVARALPGEARAEARVQREGRLWANVFSFCLAGGEYEAAYSALLGNQVAELQVDCVHRLVAELSTRGQVELLCRLPFAHTLLTMRHGRETWVPLVEEAAAALRRRAANLELDARPQPYKVLYDFHAARGNYQAAAAAQLAYARRLTAERPADRAAAEEAQRALGAALSALSLVHPDQAWLEDPAPRSLPAGGAFVDLGSAAQQQEQPQEEALPQVLTLGDLRREQATAAAHAAVAEAMPGGEATSGAPDDVFHQLLALGLYEEAFRLADAVYAGSKQDRAREKVVAALAATCAGLQARCGASGAAPRLTADDAMEDADAAADAVDNDDVAGPAAAFAVPLGPAGREAAAAASSWRLLRANIERYESTRRSGHAMRVVAVDAALGVQQQLCPPSWLLAPFRAPPPSPGAGASEQARADVAGLLRAFMRHGRLEDAAALAESHLAGITQSVPSVALARPAAVCLPHALLQELAARVQAQGGRAASAGRRLASLLVAERAAAARQTDVIEQIYT